VEIKEKARAFQIKIEGFVVNDTAIPSILYTCWKTTGFSRNGTVFAK
jgi:hypothetical protein